MRWALGANIIREGEVLWIRIDIITDRSSSRQIKHRFIFKSEKSNLMQISQIKKPLFSFTKFTRVPSSIYCEWSSKNIFRLGLRKLVLIPTRFSVKPPFPCLCFLLLFDLHCFSNCFSLVRKHDYDLYKKQDVKLYIESLASIYFS